MRVPCLERHSTQMGHSLGGLFDAIVRNFLSLDAPTDCTSNAFLPGRQLSVRPTAPFKRSVSIPAGSGDAVWWWAYRQVIREHVVHVGLIADRGVGVEVSSQALSEIDEAAPARGKAISHPRSEALNHSQRVYLPI